jgi:hypothetical protein
MDRDTYRRIEEAWERLSEVLAAEDRERERRERMLRLVEGSEAASEDAPTPSESEASPPELAGIREE